MPGKDPQATLDGFDGNGWNTWHGGAYVYNESYHATAWLGRQAEAFIRAEAHSIDRMFLAGHWLKRKQCPLDSPEGFDPNEITPERRIATFRSETVANRDGDVLRVQVFVAGVDADEVTHARKRSRTRVHARTHAQTHACARTHSLTHPGDGR